MSPNIPLPDWMPWWAQLVVLILAILFGFAFLMMPFAVFGVKGRLEFLETQLDDIQAELRMIAGRLPDPSRPATREPVFEELVRAEPTRAPSPTRTAAPAPPPVAAATVAPLQPPPAAIAPVDPVRPPSFMPPPARFPATREPSAPTPPRAPPYRDSLASGDWDDDAAPRPLRATTLRDPGREPVRDPGRDAGRDPGRDRGRSEPSLRWPPR